MATEHYGDEAIEKRLKTVAAVAGSAAALIGLYFLVCWLAGTMTYSRTDTITVKANASLCLILCGLGITLAIPEGKRSGLRTAAILFAALTMLIAGLTLVEHLFQVDLNIDELLAQEPPGARAVIHPNRMGPPAAFSLTFCGLAVILLALGSKAAMRAVQALGIVLCVVALLGMVGYLYGVEGLYGVARFTAIAWQTTVALFLLGVALLFARPSHAVMAAVTRNDLGGVAIRRLIVPAVVLPVLLGWLRLQGEWHGYYERYFGTSILVLSLVIVFTLLIYQTGKRLSAASGGEAKALDKLQRTQTLLLEAERLSHTGAWECDLLTNRWTLSDEWLRIHGAGGRSLSDEERRALIHPDDRPAIDEAFAKASSGIAGYQLEHRIVRGDNGEVRVVKAQGQFMKDRAGRVVRVYGFVQDITAQRRAQEELHLQRQLLESLVNQLPVGVLIVRGSDLRMLLVNPAYERVAAGKEMQHKTVEEVWPEIPSLGDLFRRVLASGQPYHAVDEPFEIRRSPGGALEERFFTWSLYPVQLPGEEGMGLLLTIWETSQRKRSEEALRTSENRLRSIIDYMAEGLAVIDPGSGAVDWNRRALEMYEFGAEDTASTFVETFAARYEILTLDGELVPVEQWPVNRILRGEDVVDLDLLVRTRDRGWQHIHNYNGALVRDAGGQPLMGLLNIRDITEKKRAEEALRESEELLRKVLETLPVAVWILSAEGNVLKANQAAHDIWAGIKYVGVEEFGEYKGWWLESGRRIAAEEWGGARAVLKGETSLNEEVEIECFDGSRKIILNSSVPIRNNKGEITGAITIQQDITASKKAEVALRESEEKFRAVFQKAAVGMGRVSFTDARWIDVNEAFCRMLGRTDEELLATPWPEITHPEDIDLDLIPFRRMAAGELETYSVEKRFIHKAGHYVWARLTLSLVRNPQGEPDYEIAVIEDITYRKEAEEALRKAKDELEERVRERTQELEEAYSSLKRETEERVAAVEDLRRNEQLLIQQSRLAAMGEMLGNIAHQWRQPLNILGLLIQQLPLTYELGGITKEFLDREVAHAMQVILHMSQTINDFRDFLQEEREKKPFSINEAIGTTISLFEASLKTMDVEVEIRERDELTVNGHRNEFSQVVMNIITNARDAFRERGIDSPKIVIELFREKGKAVVTIADNAGGIAPEIMERIFEPYFTTKGPDKGTGIGLFMSKNIVEKSMDGKLTVRNAGEGAEFRIEL